MSYQEYVPVMVEYLTAFSHHLQRSVSILEIGVDKGQTALPLMHNLCARNIVFNWVGVDTRQDDSFSRQVMLMEGVDPLDVRAADESSLASSRAAHIVNNSLNFLDQIADKARYDLILIDGVYNYDTVSAELCYLDRITHANSLVICDDYLDATSKAGTTKAINDFLIKESQRWSGFVPNKRHDSIFLSRGLNTKINWIDNIVQVRGDESRTPMHPKNLECQWKFVIAGA